MTSNQSGSIVKVSDCFSRLGRNKTSRYLRRLGNKRSAVPAGVEWLYLKRWNNPGPTGRIHSFSNAIRSAKTRDLARRDPSAPRALKKHDLSGRNGATLVTSLHAVHAICKKRGIIEASVNSQ